MSLKTTKLLFFCGCLILMNNIASQVNAQTDLDGKWKLTGYNFSSKQTFAIKTMKIDLTIDGNRIGGNSGCNIFGGDITFLKGAKIKIGTLTSTDMFCNETAGQFESLFTETLQNATSYSLKAGILTISAPAKKSYLRFQRFKEPAKKNPVGEKKQKSVFVSEPLIKK